MECTLNGTGERAVNTALEEIVPALTARADAFSELSTNVVTTHLAPSSRLLAQLTGLPVSVNKPVVGGNVIGQLRKSEGFNRWIEERRKGAQDEPPSMLEREGQE